MRTRSICGLMFLALALASVAEALGPSQSASAGPAQKDRKPDLTVAVETTEPKWPSRSVDIKVTVKNIGDASCPESTCHVFIRNAHSPHETVKVVKKDIRALDAHDEFLFSFPVTFGLGLFEIEVVADRGKKIAEADEANNKIKITYAGK